MFDYFWDRESCTWVPWTEKVPEYVHVPDCKFHKILVPTVDTVRTTWLLNLQVCKMGKADSIIVEPLSFLQSAQLKYNRNKTSNPEPWGYYKTVLFQFLKILFQLCREL